jgi:hypothetical protein
LFGIYRWGWGFSTSQDFNGDIALVACFASSWTPAMVRRWHADPFGSCAHGARCLRSSGARHPPRPPPPAPASSPSSWGSVEWPFCLTNVACGWGGRTDAIFKDLGYAEAQARGESRLLELFEKGFWRRAAVEAALARRAP